VTARAATAVAVAAILALPGVADAKRKHFGSDLKAPANLREAHPVDSAFWAKKLPNGHGVKVPAKGKIVAVKLKGTAIRKGSVAPVTLFHFQVLRPIGNGKVRVILTSGNFNVPVGGDPNRITTYHPVNLCAKKGDYIDFNDVGGFQSGSYPHGTPFQIFSSVMGATTNRYTKAGGSNNGDSFTGKPRQGEELLMRMTLGTGSDAGICH
jgi:hypothetical protein